MKQRIALVAVSALTAGVLSVVSTPAANAATTDLTVGGTLCGANNMTTGALINAATTYNNAAGGIQVTVPLGGSVTALGYKGEIIIVRGNSIALASGGLATAVALNTSGETILTMDATTAAAATFSATALGTTTLVAGVLAPLALTTLANKINVVVVASCSLATFSAANSFLAITTASTLVATNTDVLNVINDGSEGFIGLVAKTHWVAYSLLVFGL
jgi:hypothetical protein